MMISSMMPQQMVGTTANGTTSASASSSSSSKRKQTAPRPKPNKTCDRCEFSTNEPAEFTEHMKIEHSLGEIYPCDWCMFYTESLWDYQGHMEKHMEKSHKSSNISYSSLSTSNNTGSSSSNEEDSSIKEDEDEEDPEAENNQSMFHSSNGKSHAKEINRSNENKQLDENFESDELAYDDMPVQLSSSNEQLIKTQTGEFEEDEEDGDEDEGSSTTTTSSTCHKQRLFIKQLSDEIALTQQQLNKKIKSKKENTTTINNNGSINEVEDLDEEEEDEEECDEDDDDEEENKMIFDMSQLAAMKYNAHHMDPNNNNQFAMAKSLMTESSSPVTEKAKRHYNSEVDPARYRKVVEEGMTKFACSICGNTYKWRKSLNKHWKEKHITETPPPLDAPVTVKLRNGTTTVNCTSASSTPKLGSGGASNTSSNSKPSPSVVKPNNFKSASTNENMYQKSMHNSNGNNNTSNSKFQYPSMPLNSAQQPQQPQRPLLPNQSFLNPFDFNNANGANPAGIPNNLASYFSAFQQLLANNSLFNPQLNQQINPTATAAAQKQQINTPTSKSTSNNNGSALKNSTKNAFSSSDLANHHETPLDLSMKSESTHVSRQQQASKREANSQNLVSQAISMLNKNNNADKNGHNSRSSSISSHRSLRSNNTSPNNSRSNSPNQQSNMDNMNEYSDETSMLMSTSMTTPSRKSQLNSSAAQQQTYNQKLFVCSICDAKFHVVDQINDHFSKNHINEYQRELSSKSPPRNTNVAQQNEEWNLSDPNNPLKCIKCDFVGRWPTELQKHAASHSTSRPFKCLICSLTYKWRWDLAKHFDRTHPAFRNPYKKRDRDAARSNIVGKPSNNHSNSSFADEDHNRSRSESPSDNQPPPMKFKNAYALSPSTAQTLNNNSAKKSQSTSNLVGNKPNPVNSHPTPKAAKLPNMKFEQISINPNTPPASYVSLSGSSSNSSTNNGNVAAAAAAAAAAATNPFANISPSTAAQMMSTNPNMYAAAYLASLAAANQQTQPPNPTQLLASHFQKLPFFQPPPPPLSMPVREGQAQTTNDSKQPPNALLAALIPQLFGGNTSMMNPLASMQQQIQSANVTEPNSSASPSPPPLNSQYSNLNKSSSSSNLSVKKFKSNASSTSSSAHTSHSVDGNSSGHGSGDEATTATGGKGGNEARNFLCYWCDFRGRWRSEIIQHMRCHHAREKPYRCSACMYASNWKWDVQKHTKKQHPHDPHAKIVEIPDQVLFPDIKDFNFLDNGKLGEEEQTPTQIKKSISLSLTPPSSSSSSSTSSISSTETNKKPQPQPLSPKESTAASNLCCQQCPYVACNLSDLRRHLIVHSNEQPYHCCSCSYKSKWKSEVKKHQRAHNHIGPILVGKKAMQKVIESLGLDKSSMVNLYGPNIQVIDNKQCKSNEKLIDEDHHMDYNEMNKLNSGNLKPSKKRKFDEFEEYDDDDDEDVYEELNEDEEDELFDPVVQNNAYDDELAYEHNNTNDDHEKVDQNNDLDEEELVEASLMPGEDGDELEIDQDDF